MLLLLGDWLAICLFPFCQAIHPIHRFEGMAGKSAVEPLRQLPQTNDAVRLEQRESEFEHNGTATTLCVKSTAMWMTLVEYLE